MLKALVLITTITLIIPCAAASAASQELTFSLETPALSSTQAPNPHVDARAVDPPAARPEQKNAAKKGNSLVVGRVGVVQVSTAYVYISKSASSRKYTTVRKETPLAIVREEGEWYGVLMTDRSVGWIPTKNVRMTDYNLVQKKPDTRSAATTSRGGVTDRISAVSSELLQVAMRYSGVRYVFGGTSPARGMDCSAFVRSVFSQFGVNLPRTAREQAKVGTPVPFDQLKPGDRLYFSCYNPYVDHCGIYAGKGNFVHCSKSRNGIGLDSLATDFFWRSLVAARRS